MRWGLFLAAWMALAGLNAGSAGAERALPVHRSDDRPTVASNESNEIAGAVVDLAVHPRLDLLLAVSPESVFILNLPDLSPLADLKTSGHVINAGFLNSDPSAGLRYFLVSAAGRDVVTDFYDYDPGRKKSRRIGSDRSSFYRAAGSALLRQNQGRQEPLAGPVAVVRLNERNKPVRLLDLPLPTATPLYAFALLSGDESSDVARIEPDGRLARHRFQDQEWRRVWTVEPGYGGGDVELRALDRRTPIERDQGVVAADVDGKPGQEILAVERRRNPNPLGAVIGKRFESARVAAIDEGGRLLWTTDWLEGTIPALAVWREFVIIAHVPSGEKRTAIYLNRLGRPLLHEEETTGE